MTGFKSPVLQKSRIFSIAYSLNLRDIEKFLLTASFLCLSGRVTITLIETHLNNKSILCHNVATFGNQQSMYVKIIRSFAFQPVVRSSDLH